MRNGSLQLAPQNYIDNQVVRMPHGQMQHDDETSPSFILQAFKRRWYLILAGLLLSIAGGIFGYQNLKLESSLTFGQVLYTPLPGIVGEQANNTEYKPMTVTEIMVANDIVRPLIERNQLQVTPKRLREILSVQAPYNSTLIHVELAWTAPDESIAIVNDFMKLASEKFLQHRRELLAQSRTHIETRLTDLKAQVEHCSNEVLRQRREQLAGSVADGDAMEEEQILEQLRTVQGMLDDVMRRRVNTLAQLRALKTIVKEVESQLKVDLLQARVKQFEERKLIYAKNFKTSRMDELERQLTTFAQENADLTYSEWRVKLENLGTTLLPPIDGATMTQIASAEISLQQKIDQVQQLEIDALAMEEEAANLTETLQSARRSWKDSIGESKVVSTTLDEAEAALGEAIARRNTAEEKLANIRLMEQSEIPELRIYTPASMETTEYSEGRKKTAALMFVGLMTVLVVPIFLFEAVFPSGDPAERAATSTGLPLVGTGTFVAKRLTNDRFSSMKSESLRLLALRIQQSVQSSGAMVLFSGINHRKSSIPMITYLAECLSRREERVLIIDGYDPDDSKKPVKVEISSKIALASPKLEPVAVGHGGDDSDLRSSDDETESRELVNSESLDAEGLGLSDFLSRRNLSIDQIINATSIPGVDMISSGTNQLPSEAFASKQLTELLEECRERYTLILMAGPPTSHPSDLQMLAARAEGVLFTVPKNGQHRGNGEDVVRELVNLGAPIIGVVG
ncbi:MAG: hypothetical protein R3C28_17585 [Pirellulaceae bacterium]